MKGKLIDMIGKMSSAGMTREQILKMKQSTASGDDAEVARTGAVAGKPSEKDINVWQCTVCGNTVDAYRAQADASKVCERCGSPMQLLDVAQTSLPTEK